jgi:transcriptional regulator GlxA family with amidase domain
MVEYLIQEVSDTDAPPSLHLLTEFEQLVIVGFLTANPSNLSHLLESQLYDPAPWHVRRVEEYLEANWDKPVAIEDIARETGVGTMFVAFKKARGYTPMAFLQRIRLQHARRMLQQADDTTSVSGVSLNCLFYNLGHFARYYHKAFGELPSATPMNARGPGGRLQ